MLAHTAVILTLTLGLGVSVHAESADWRAAASQLLGSGTPSAASDATDTPILGTTSADALIDKVAGQLGISGDQASGALGSVFQFAKTQLDSGQFEQLSSALPGLDGLLEAAPNTVSGAGGNGLNGLLGQAGDYGKSLSAAGDVVSAFRELGLSSALIPQVIDIAGNYLNSEAGGETANLFKQAVSALTGR